MSNKTMPFFIWYLLFSFLAISSCTSEQEAESQQASVNTFKDAITISGKQVLEEAIGVMCVDVIDTRLTIYSPDSKDAIIDEENQLLFGLDYHSDQI